MWGGGREGDGEEDDGGEDVEAPARVRARESGERKRVQWDNRWTGKRSGGWRKEVGAIPHLPPFPDFKDSPSEKELFSSAQAYRFGTPLFYSQKRPSFVKTASNPFWGERSCKWGVQGLLCRPFYTLQQSKSCGFYFKSQFASLTQSFSNYSSLKKFTHIWSTLCTQTTLRNLQLLL